MQLKSSNEEFMIDNNKELWIIDSTLRDGEQAPGVVFSRKEKLRLDSMLDSIGIDEIEAGIPAMGAESIDIIRDINRLRLKSRVLVWSRALTNDIETAARTNAEAIHIAFPISDIQLSTMNKEWSWVTNNIPQMVDHAQKYFKYVSIGAQDASRCGIDRLLEFIAIAEKSKVGRVRLADTVGIFTPMETMNLITNIKSSYPRINLEFHAHNDLGMATANAVTGWQTGAKSVSVTVNGLGERAGNAALEEFLMAIKLHAQTEKYDTSNLFSLCRFVSKISNRPIPLDKAICGKMVFSHESGIHAGAMLKNQSSFQPFDGKLIGRESFCNVFGKHSGRGALKYLLEQHHIFASDSEMIELKKIINRLSEEKRRNISDEEVLREYFKMEYNIQYTSHKYI